METVRFFLHQHHQLSGNDTFSLSLHTRVVEVESVSAEPFPGGFGSSIVPGIEREVLYTSNPNVAK